MPGEQVLVHTLIELADDPVEDVDSEALATTVPDR